MRVSPAARPQAGPGKLPVVLRGVNSQRGPLGRGARGPRAGNAGWLGVAVLCVPLAACGLAPGRTVRQVPPGEWTATLGDARRAPFAAQSAPEAPVEQWRRGLERGILSAPVLHEDLLIIAASSRVLMTVSARDGDRFWRRRFNGPVMGPALRQGERIFVGTAARDGRFYAFDIRRGRRLWDTRLRSPVTADPVLAGDRIIASTVRGELSALHVDDGRILWRAAIPGPQLGAPVIDGGAVLIATARDTLLRIDTSNGRILATRALPGTPSAPMARGGNTLLVPVHPRMVAHYSLPELELVRVDTLGAAVLAAPAIAADGSAFLLTATAELWRSDANGAGRIATLGGAARESLTLARNGLLVGRLDGTLFLLRTDGSEVWRREFEGALRAPVVLGGGAAFVTLQSGDLVKLQ